MAPNYISSIITKLTETIVAETAHERGMKLDMEQEAVHEVGWTIHGAISHYAIRRHIYRASHVIPQDMVVAMHVRVFLSGFDSIVSQFERVER